MAYMQLGAELRINTKPFEQGLEFADTMGKAFVRSAWTVPLRVDTQTFGKQLGGVKRALQSIGKLTVGVDVSLKVNGTAMVIEQNKRAAASTKQVETAANQAGKALNNALKGVVSNARAEKDLQRIGYSLRDAKRFSMDFNAHMIKMQALLEGTGLAGQQAGAKLAASMRQAEQGAQRASVQQRGLGRSMDLLNGVGRSVAKTFLSIYNTISRWAIGYLFVSQMIRGVQALQDATVGYNITVQRTTTSLTSMFKGNQMAAKGLLDTLERVAMKTSYSFEDLAQLTPQLVTAGVAAKDVVQTFIALGDASVAGGKGVEGVRNLVGDILSMSSRGKVTGMDIRNFGANSVKIVQYLAQAYSEVLPKGTKAAEMAMRSMTTKGLIPADKAIKAIVAGIENDPLKAGQMEKQARTYEGAMSNIGDAIKRVLGKEAFGDVFELMTKSALAFVDFVSSPKFTAWGKSLAPKLRELAETAINVGAAMYDMGQQIASAIGWAASIIGDKLPYILGVIAALSAPAMLLRIKALGDALFLAFSKANIPILLTTAAVVAFIAAYRNFSFVQDFTEVVVGGTLTALKGLSFGFQKLRGELGAIVQGAGWVMGNQGWINWGKSQQGLEKSTAKYWDGIIEGWRNTGNKKLRAFMTSDYRKMFGMQDIAKSLFAGVENTKLPAPPAMPKYGADDLNTNPANAAKAQKKALQELEKAYLKAAKAAEESAKRQIDALKGVRDKLQDLLGGFQDVLAKYGILNSPLDALIGRIEKLTGLGPRMLEVATNAAKISSEMRGAASAARGQIQSLDAAASAGSSAGANTPTSRIITTFKTREEMLWTTAFKDIAQKSSRVQELVRRDFKGNWDKMFEVMGNTSFETRKRLVRLAEPSSSSSTVRFAHPEQWSTQRYGKLVDSFLMAARMQVGPRSSVPRVSGRNPAFEGDAGLSTQDYNVIVERKARQLADAYLRKTGQLQTVTTTVSGWPKNFDFGTIKRTQQTFQQRVSVPGSGATTPGVMPASTALVSAGKAAGSTLIENLVREFNDKSPRKLGASCADVASNVLNTLGEKLKYSANAAQLKRNALAAGWVMVPLGTPGALHIQSGAGFGKISGAHTTVGVGNGMVAGSSGYKFQKYKITGAKGHPIALMPPGGLNGIPASVAAKFAKAGGVSGAAGLEEGQNPGEDLMAIVQSELANLRLGKYVALPKEFGRAIAQSDEHSARFTAQMLIAQRNIQEQWKKLYGEKGFLRMASMLGQISDLVDRMELRLKLTADATQQSREWTRAQRLRGHENDPVFALRNQFTRGGQSMIPIFQLAQLENQARTGSLQKVTDQLKPLKRALDDQRASLKLSRQFIQGTTVDTYGLARAQELLTKRLEFSRTEGMQELWHTNRKQFNLNLSAFGRVSAAQYDDAKGEERRQFAVNMRTDFARENKLLQDRLGIVRDWTGGEADLNDKLAIRETVLKKIDELRYGMGFGLGRAMALANEIAAHEQINRLLERRIGWAREMGKQMQELANSQQLNAILRNVFAFTRGDSPEQARAVFAAQTRADLERKFANGEIGDVATQYGIEMGKYDDNQRTDRLGGASSRLAQMQNDLLQKRLEINRSLSEVAKLQLDFQIQGVALTAEEANKRAQMLLTAKKLDDLKPGAWLQNQQMGNVLAGIFNPNARADQQFVFDKFGEGWSDAQIEKMLPVDQMLRKQREAFDRMQGLLDDWKGSWQSMFRDIATKGEFSFGSFLDNITNRLSQWGADTLSSAAWNGLQSLLGNFASGLLRSNTTPLAVPISGASGGGIAAGLAAGGHGLFNTTSAMQSDYMMRAARDLTAGAARQTAAVAGGGAGAVAPVYDFSGSIFPNVRHERDIPSAAGEIMSGGMRNSRRTNAKQGNRFLSGSNG